MLDSTDYIYDVNEDHSEYLWALLKTTQTEVRRAMRVVVKEEK